MTHSWPEDTLGAIRRSEIANHYNMLDSIISPKERSAAQLPCRRLRSKPPRIRLLVPMEWWFRALRRQCNVKHLVFHRGRFPSCTVFGGRRGCLKTAFGIITFCSLMFTISCLNACSTSSPATMAVRTSPPTLGGNSDSTIIGEQDQPNSQRLETLWKVRTAQQNSTDFPLGPGDVLEVSVPDMEELTNRQARVSADDVIQLPVVGALSVKGMGEQEVSVELRNRLKQYMKDPQVDIFVKQYRSRQVAVAGMVQRPGLYTLTGRSDTILDVIGRAGGMKETAGTHIVFIPATSIHDVAIVSAEGEKGSEFNDPRQVATVADAQRSKSSSLEERTAAVVDSSGTSSDESIPQYDGAQADYKQSDPLVISIHSLRRNTDFDLPVWPGDVIIVPAAGEVMVRGWVKNPGAFNITPGMTVLGAITAAGGELFSSSVDILRTTDNGDEIHLQVNLSEIQQGAEPDVPVQAGDVVIVNRSIVGAVPYFAYGLLKSFSAGAYLPLPLF